MLSILFFHLNEDFGRDPRNPVGRAAGRQPAQVGPAAPGGPRPGPGTHGPGLIDHDRRTNLSLPQVLHV